MSKTTIKQFDGTSVRKIMDEAREALEPIAEKYGLVLSRKGSTYHRDSLPVMLQFLIKQTDTDGNILTAEAKDFQKYAVMFGLKPEDLGREFVSRGETFRITGLKPKSPKFPVLAENVRSGKSFKFPEAVVLAGLKKAA
jgi:hypothetical protein